jgi:hypothetical protein
MGMSCRRLATAVAVSGAMLEQEGAWKLLAQKTFRV